MPTGHALTVRGATESDLAPLAQLVTEVRDNSPLGSHLVAPGAAVVVDYLRAFLAASNTILLLAEHNGEEVGFAMASKIGPGLMSERGYLQLEALYVTQGNRRTGAGRVLMHRLVSVAASAELDQVVTMPLSGERSEQRFLGGLGFLPVGARRIADTASLIRRIEERQTGRRRRTGKVEDLIARRRRSRGLPPTPPSGLELGALAAQEAERSSMSMHVKRHVHSRRSSSSTRTIS